jgi:hypothetical protein
LPANLTTFSIKTYKHHTINISTNQITFGIQTRQEFKQACNLKLVFWLRGVHNSFLADDTHILNPTHVVPIAFDHFVFQLASMALVV